MKSSITASPQRIVSILDIDLSASIPGSYTRILNSPRTIEAMKNLGILGSELDDTSYDTVRENLIKRERKANIPTMLVDLRYDNI